MDSNYHDLVNQVARVAGASVLVTATADDGTVATFEVPTAYVKVRIVHPPLHSEPGPPVYELLIVGHRLTQTMRSGGTSDHAIR